MRHSSQRYRFGQTDMPTIREELRKAQNAVTYATWMRSKWLQTAVDEGMPMSEAAGILGVSKSTAHRMYHDFTEANRLVDETIPVDDTTADLERRS